MFSIIFSKSSELYYFRSPLSLCCNMQMCFHLCFQFLLSHCSVIVWSPSYTPCHLSFIHIKHCAIMLQYLKFYVCLVCQCPQLLMFILHLLVLETIWTPFIIVLSSTFLSSYAQCLSTIHHSAPVVLTGGLRFGWILYLFLIPQYRRPGRTSILCRLDFLV